MILGEEEPVAQNTYEVLAKVDMNRDYSSIHRDLAEDFGVDPNPEDK
ncbi:MAG: hypothetical protein H0X71_02705 [Rubrobacter sp.]|nr:hypothetical protein [Rubrobacter sp.]